jgi:2-C-methyl-D-erythritol 4-phosphate cytidylyltransferase
VTPVRRLGIVPVGQDDRLAPAGCAALRTLRDVPLVRRAVGALARAGVLDAVVVVVPPALLEPIGALLATLPAGGPTVDVLPAQENGPGLRVRAALRARRPDPAGIVVVHDPLFPLAPAALVRAVVGPLDDLAFDDLAFDDLARDDDDPELHVPAPPPVAVVPVRPVTDTLKQVDEDDVVTATVSRDGFRMVYSPQAFRTAALIAALDAADDAALRRHGADVLPRLVQAGGGRLHSVLAPGEVFRIAQADDLVLAEAMLHVGADVDDELPAAPR